jgi:peroxiredoxin
MCVNVAPRLVVAILTFGITSGAAQDLTSGDKAKGRHREGHSSFGEAFDEGPRERPALMTGLGRTHFPITATPEAQKWFDQGHTLLHSFWYYEAERAFRWAAKLDSAAPMPYWGLARATNGARAKAFWKEADQRKANATPREREFIAAWGHLYSEDAPTGTARQEELVRALERIVMRYPADVEAKALLANETMGRSRAGTELLIQEILAADPEHPGAHHYRIHNWDDEDGALALTSSRKYGDIAPAIGHALHMPGHIYSGLGMYHEAAISLDAATRAEIAYMGRQMVFPFNTWNYAHNRTYLSYVQEQLGLPSEAIRGARELLAVPLDPSLNDATRSSPHWRGIASLVRALVKYERWDDLLKEGYVPYSTSLRDRLAKTYAEALARIGKNQLAETRSAVASHDDLKAEINKPENRSFRLQYEIQDLDLRGSLAILKGDTLDGIALLTQAAPQELELRRQYDDPPSFPTLMWVKVGRAYLAENSPRLAMHAFKKAVEAVPNDPFALAGLVEAHYRQGDSAAAADALGRLLYVWSDAEPGNPWLDRARSFGVLAAPHNSAPADQRNYRRTTLDHYGPAIWTPFAAPTLDVRDHTGNALRLDQFRGRNVILVFYLGHGCAHCVQQLKELHDRSAEWERLDTTVVAVSQDTPKQNAKSQSTQPLKLVLGSDSGFENARRFKSYDDFEEIAIHATILIDKGGRVHWARHGGGPFTDYAFLASQLERMNAIRPASPQTTTAR